VSRIIHGKAHEAIRHFREKPAALSVYLIYVSRANKDNTAWPSVRGLERDTGWSHATCSEARQWLADHGALIEDPEYIRPEWRKLSGNELNKVKNIDQAQYFKPSGSITVDGETLDLLYAPVGEETDDLPGRSSVGTDMRPDSTELDSIGSKGDSNKNHTSTDVVSKFGFAIGNPAWYVEEPDNAIPITHEVLVIGFTEKMVKFTMPDGTVKRCKPNTLWKSPPKLERKTTPLEDVIGELVLSISPDAQIGKKVAIRLKGYSAEILAVYPAITPEEVHTAFIWKGRRFRPSSPTMVVKMIGDFRAEHKPAVRENIPTLTDEQKAAIRAEMFEGPNVPRGDADGN
jgi:hypothetical protein